MPTTWIVVGANRGIGLEFVRELSARPDTVVIATVRTLANESTYTSLSSLKPAGANSHISIYEIDTSSIPSITAFAAALKSSPHTHVDYLLNSAAINVGGDKDALELDGDDLQEHIKINVVGPAALISALVASSHLKKGSVILNMTSGLASLTHTQTSFGQGWTKAPAYSISKAALNMLTLHQASAVKEKGVRVICMDPGWVKTDMGGEGAQLEPEESVGGMLKVLDALGEEETGVSYNYKGEIVPW